MTLPAAAPKVAEEVERAAFEAWHRRVFPGDPLTWVGAPDGDYRIGAVEHRWLTWKAARANLAALVAATREENEKLRATLTFYADRLLYTHPDGQCSRACHDEGKRARRALDLDANGSPSRAAEPKDKASPEGTKGGDGA